MRTMQSSESVALLVDETFAFTPHELAAAKSLARSRPWRGTLDERKAKFLAGVRAFAIDGPGLATDKREHARSGAAVVVFGVLDGSDSAASGVLVRDGGPVAHLRGRLSVVTLFWCLATAAGRRDAMAWAVNLFRVAFPKSFARCDLSGPCVRNFRRLNPGAVN